MRYRQIVTRIESIDNALRTIRLCGTSESPDRYNSKIMRSGWVNLKQYLAKNPVFFWAHDSKSMPIGQVTAITPSMVDTEQGKFKALDFDVMFPDKRTYPFGYLVFDMYRKKFLRGSSVGFNPLTVTTVQDEDQLKELQLSPPMGTVYERQELLEFSAAPIPGNEDALSKELSGFVSEERLGAVIRTLSIEKTDPKFQEALSDWLLESLGKIKRSIDNAGSGAVLTAENFIFPELTIEKAASWGSHPIGTYDIDPNGEIMKKRETPSTLDMMLRGDVSFDLKEGTTLTIGDPPPAAEPPKEPEKKREVNADYLAECLDNLESMADGMMNEVSRLRDLMDFGDGGSQETAPTPAEPRTAKINAKLEERFSALEKRFFDLFDGFAKKNDLEALRAEVGRVCEMTERMLALSVAANSAARAVGAKAGSETVIKELATRNLKVLKATEDALKDFI